MAILAFVLFLPFGTLLTMFLLPYFLGGSAFKNCPTPDAIFQAHWVERGTLRLRLQKNGFLHKEPHRISEMTLWESVWYWFEDWSRLISRKAFDVVDDFMIGPKGEQARVQTWLVNATETHFKLLDKVTKLYKLYRGKKGKTMLDKCFVVFYGLCAKFLFGHIVGKMMRTAEEAHKRGITFIGEGALCKDRELTHDGEDYPKYLAKKGYRTRPFFAHGDTLTAQVVYLQAMNLLQHHIKVPTSVYITGASSKIGVPVGIMLAAHGYRVFCNSESAQRVEEIKKKAEAYAPGAGERIFFSEKVNTSDLAECNLVITGKSKYAEELKQAMKPGTTLLNFAVPDPFTPSNLDGLPFYHVDGGSLDYSDVPNNLTFAMRLIAGKITYSCHAWTLICAITGRTGEDELGAVDLDQMEEFWAIAQSLGFKLPEATDFLHPAVLPTPGGMPVAHKTPEPPVRTRRADGTSIAA